MVNLDPIEYKVVVHCGNPHSTNNSIHCGA